MMYYCPTSNEVEDDEHGGFDVCCDRPDLHDPLTPDELLSLKLATSLRSMHARINYFAIKRCVDCTDRETCDFHMRRWRF